jgi:ribonuclease P protein subunit POP4
MKVTPEIVCHEFIGTQAKVAKSTNPDMKGLSGKIIDETRNTFTLLEEGERKTAAKSSNLFHFRFSDGTVVEIDGRLLVGRPEDRLKKSIRRLW